MIEIGRYNPTTKNNGRWAPFLWIQFNRTYSMIRNNFYNKTKTLIPNTTQLPVKVLIHELMNSSYYCINIITPILIKILKSGNSSNMFQLTLILVTNYYQSNVVAL